MSDVTISRRALLGAAGLAGGMLAFPGALRLPNATAQTPEPLKELTIDLSGEPESIDPAVAYAARDWSIVHSIYDALVGIAGDGNIQPLAAESFAAVDPVTFEAKLRAGMVFHDGSPVTAEAAVRGIDHLKQADSKVIDLFKPITKVDVVDDLTLRIVCDAPSPWLPAQLAVWHVLLPEGATPDSLATKPVGSGPYRFVDYEHGSQITLERNPDYTPSPVKGAALAERVVYRFVPDAATRVADLATGAAQLIVEVPQDQATAVQSAGADFVATGIVGSSWIRIATDTKPFDDARVRQALNLALDVESIAQALVSPEAHRIASIFPDKRAMGFDPELAPYAYDPDKAKALLAEAGHSDGLETALEITTAAPQAVAEAMVAQWREVGIKVTVKASEYAAFNATWADSSAPPLRMSTWSPLFDPQTLLGLVFAADGYLSRYKNAEADGLIKSGAVETDPAKRAETYRSLARVMHDDAAAVFLWNLVANYGVAKSASAWQPRGDEYVLAVG